MESKYLIKIIDPLKLEEKDLPLIVLSDDRRGVFGWAIRNHTSGNYSHAMVMNKPGKLATQGFKTFHETDIKTYLNNRQMLKFWKIKDITKEESETILKNIDRRLALPWYKKQYDWVGIFGQFLKLKFIQNPLQKFCSEQVRADYIAPIDRAARLIIKQPSPSDLDRIFRTSPNIFEVVGYWFTD